MGFILSVIALAGLVMATVLAFGLSRRSSSTGLWLIACGFLVITLRTALPLYAPVLPFSIELPSSVLLFFFGALISVGALLTTRIFREMAFHQELLGIISDIDRAICSRMDIKNVLEMFSRKVARFFGADAIAIVRMMPETGELGLLAGSSLSESYKKAFAENRGDGLSNLVIKNRKVLHIADVQSDPRAAIVQWFRDEGFKSYLGAPMIVKGREVGVLSLMTRSQRRFGFPDNHFFTALTGQLAIAISNAQVYQNLQLLYSETINSLVQAIETRDEYTKGHSKQVSTVAGAIARRLKMDEADVEMITYAGLLHDIGKIGVDGRIIHKNGPLDDEEWKVMKRHPIESVKIIKQIGQLKVVTNWVLHHHERWDGKGYNDGLAGEAIPFESRILAVADTFSALTGDRPYRKARSVDFAVHEIKAVAGTQLDPTVVDAFTCMIAEEKGRINSSPLPVASGL